MSNGKPYDDERLPWLQDVDDKNVAARNDKGRKFSQIEYPIDRALSTAVLATVAIGGYFSVPVLRFTDPEWLQVFGLMLGFGAGGWWFAAKIGRGLRWQIPMILFVMIALIGLSRLVANALDESEKNHSRCAAVQSDMLSANPSRSDGPDLFQALRCRPQGDQNVSFPKRLPAAK